MHNTPHLSLIHACTYYMVCSSWGSKCIKRIHNIYKDKNVCMMVANSLWQMVVCIKKVVGTWRRHG